MFWCFLCLKRMRLGSHMGEKGTFGPLFLQSEHSLSLIRSLRTISDFVCTYNKPTNVQKYRKDWNDWRITKCKVSSQVTLRICSLCSQLEVTLTFLLVWNVLKQIKINSERLLCECKLDYFIQEFNRKTNDLSPGINSISIISITY